MFFIHQTSCISPQETFSNVKMDLLHVSVHNKLLAIEPAYTGVAVGVLRRMGKASRIGMGTAMRLIQEGAAPDGLIIGTANGGMEESIRFLKQIIEYHEDMLAPGSFVQSTANAIATQLSMLTKNKGYNITHVHKGLAFENAVIDTAMLLMENPGNTYLLGGVDEIASYNYIIEHTAGWYKKEYTSNQDLYKRNSAGTIAGEGAAMFLVNNKKEQAIAELTALTTLHSTDKELISGQLKAFLKKNVPSGESINLFLTGENGDARDADLVASCESAFGNETTVARFKHMCGEYPTASAFALWLACYLPIDQPLPEHMLKKQGTTNKNRTVLIYNYHKNVQHSFMLVTKFK